MSPDHSAKAPSADNDVYPGLLCRAKIRMMRPLNETEIECGLTEGSHRTHSGALRDYAYPGSVTMVNWDDTDRRCFYGPWQECPDPGCILPNLHKGRHAQ